MSHALVVCCTWSRLVCPTLTFATAGEPWPPIVSSLWHVRSGDDADASSGGRSQCASARTYATEARKLDRATSQVRPWDVRAVEVTWHVVCRHSSMGTARHTARRSCIGQACPCLPTLECHLPIRSMIRAASPASSRWASHRAHVGPYTL